MRILQDRSPLEGLKNVSAQIELDAENGNGSAVCGQEEKLPFLVAGWRSAARAVKGAVYAFIGAKRRPLTEEARSGARGPL